MKRTSFVLRLLPRARASPLTSTPGFTLTIPKRSPRLRIIGLLYGGIVLLWLSVEDNNALEVAILGAGLAILCLTFWITGRFGGRVLERRTALFAAALAGAISGLLGTLLTAALMLFKVGLHADDFPDFPFGMMVDMVARAPLWALAGIFAGIGLLLAWWAVDTRDKS